MREIKGLIKLNAGSIIEDQDGPKSKSYSKGVVSAHLPIVYIVLALLSLF